MAIDRLTQIDELTRGDHYYLTDDDICFYFGEYTAKKGYSYSDTNQLITNLKISPKHKATPRWYYKQSAIRQAGQAFRRNINRDWVEQDGIFVPIPPSKTKDHPEYDGRVADILTTGFQGYECDIRELILQSESMPADHETEDRIDLDELYKLYSIDESLCDPAPTQIAIVDDVLTTGKHYVAAKRRLSEAFPEADIIGLFVARVIHDADFDVMFDDD